MYSAPTKSMLDYMTEMNRIFPRIGENDIFQSPATPNPSVHFFNQSMARSSSSTDTSQDSFPDMLAHRFPPEAFHQYERDFKHDYQRQEHKPEMQEVPYSPQLFETPNVLRRHRPIVGRKIMASDSRISKIDEFNTWSETLQQTQPYKDQKFKQNPLYELFPDTKTEFKTPVKTHSYNMSPNMVNVSSRMSGMMNVSPKTREMSPWLRDMSPRVPEMSPRMSEMSPRMPEMSPKISGMSPRLAEMSPIMSETSLWQPEISPRPEMSPRLSLMSPMPESPNKNISPGSSPYSPRFPTPFKEPIIGPSMNRTNGPGKMCTFCRKNGETPLVYMTHVVKEKVGNRNVVTCPILRSHVCATCKASGDNAHTITYCPVLRSNNNGRPLQSTTVTLKNTRVKSNGRRRY